MAVTFEPISVHHGPPHPIAQTLINVTIELLEDTPIENISLAAVLKKSGVSNGSLYHHFEDLQELLEIAIVERFTKGLNESLIAIAALLEITDRNEFRRRVEEIILLFHEQNRRPFRMTRLDTLGAVSSRPRLAERIGRAQYLSTMKQGQYLAEFQRRGWFRQDLDMDAVSTFMTATFLGRVVDDIASEQIDPESWNKVALTAFRAILFPE